MSWMIVALALSTGCPASPAYSDDEAQVYPSMQRAIEEIRPTLQTGSLIATQGDCLAVRIYTQSPITHVAAVVLRNGEPFVYDAANGPGVRCQTLENYLKSQSPKELKLFHPKQAFAADDAARFEKWLDSQLGRPYAVSHHLTGERSSGLHCAEYVTDALQSCGRITAKQPARVSPASLIEGVTQNGVYQVAAMVHIEPPQPVVTNSEAGWCERMWRDTKTCTSDCRRQTRAWFACR